MIWLHHHFPTLPFVLGFCLGQQARYEWWYGLCSNFNPLPSPGNGIQLVCDCLKFRETIEGTRRLKAGTFVTVEVLLFKKSNSMIVKQYCRYFDKRMKVNREQETYLLNQI